MTYMLRDITILNYRCFQSFYIDNLARVNLIVGMNNSGKTSLLEAIYLLVNQGESPRYLIDILNSRGDINKSFNKNLFNQSFRIYNEELKNIFQGYQISTHHPIRIISQKQDPLSLAIEPQLSDRNLLNSENFEIVFSYGLQLENQIIVHSDGTIRSQDGLFLNSNYSSQFLTISTLSFEEMAELWNSILLTPKENKVVEALQILEPSVERIGFTSHPTSTHSILLKLSGNLNPLPLTSMGDGIRRILAIAIAAVTVENGFLLVDEIDTGLYYQTQTDMWHFVLEVAKQLNVQVFATTHSWDCITAFAEAIAQSEERSVGKLFRLSRRDENIRAVEYTPDELSIAVNQSIEVR
ncbi:AAA family ATPase [Scytonema sp. NUACC26]|uniref:AAA family ATPase n=1 Tax=Scytonema sp. NUACC26 TaxID=3140176 RepID=UPI0034DC4FD0